MSSPTLFDGSALLLQGSLFDLPELDDYGGPGLVSFQTSQLGSSIRQAFAAYDDEDIVVDSNKDDVSRCQR